MGDRGGQLSHRGDAIGMRKLHLCLAVAPLAFAGLGFRPLALRQIKHEADPMVLTFLEQCPADQHRHTAAIFPEILLLERLHCPDHLQVRDSLCVAVAPFRRRQVRPAYATRDKIVPVVSNHAKKRVIGVENMTFDIPDDDPDDVGVDQAPDFLVALLKVALELDVFRGRLPPPSRFEPCEGQRRPCQDRDHDDWRQR